MVWEAVAQGLWEIYVELHGLGGRSEGKRNLYGVDVVFRGVGWEFDVDGGFGMDVVEGVIGLLVFDVELKTLRLDVDDL